MTDSSEDIPSVFNEHCGARQALNLIADKWAALVICALSRDTKRYNQLKRQISGVSQKMLTQTLRNMERDGLVLRQVYPEVPPKVEYSLTPLGETLLEPIASLCHWAEIHYPEIEAVRAKSQTLG